MTKWVVTFWWIWAIFETHVTPSTPYTASENSIVAIKIKKFYAICKEPHFFFEVMTFFFFIEQVGCTLQVSVVHTSIDLTENQTNNNEPLSKLPIHALSCKSASFSIYTKYTPIYSPCFPFSLVQVKNDDKWVFEIKISCSQLRVGKG